MRRIRALAPPSHSRWNILLPLPLVTAPALAIDDVLIEPTGRKILASPSTTASDSRAHGVEPPREDLCQGFLFCPLPNRPPGSSRLGPQRRERGTAPDVTD